MIQISARFIRNPLIRRVFAIYNKFPLLRNLPIIFVDAEGFRYHAEIQDWWRFAKPFEPLTREFLVKNAEENDVFLDVGAHIGIYTVRLAEIVRRVIALEPEPRNYRFLLRNVIINGVNDRVVVLPIAASDRDGYAYLCIKRSSGAHSLEEAKSCVKRVKVIIMNIDTLLRILNVDRVDMVKIDVEGHEDKVVKGMTNLLDRNPPRVIVLETKKENLNLRSYLVEKGYRYTVLDCWDSTCNYGFYLVK
mgnify:CR=1 FL=1